MACEKEARLGSPGAALNSSWPSPLLGHTGGGNGHPEGPSPPPPTHSGSVTTPPGGFLIKKE